MNWFATIVSLLLIAIGGTYIFRPESAAKWDRAVGRQRATAFVYKVMGLILFGSGLIYLVLFNYLSLIRN
jgi:hypothetical protein